MSQVSSKCQVQHTKSVLEKPPFALHHINIEFDTGNRVLPQGIKYGTLIHIKDTTNEF